MCLTARKRHWQGKVPKRVGVMINRDNLTIVTSNSRTDTGAIADVQYAADEFPHMIPMP